MFYDQYDFLPCCSMDMHFIAEHQEKWQLKMESLHSNLHLSLLLLYPLYSLSVYSLGYLRQGRLDKGKDCWSQPSLLCLELGDIRTKSHRPGGSRVWPPSHVPQEQASWSRFPSNMCQYTFSSFISETVQIPWHSHCCPIQVPRAKQGSLHFTNGRALQLCALRGKRGPLLGRSAPALPAQPCRNSFWSEVFWSYSDSSLIWASFN